MYIVYWVIAIIRVDVPLVTRVTTKYFEFAYFCFSLGNFGMYSVLKFSGQIFEERNEEEGRNLGAEGMN